MSVTKTATAARCRICTRELALPATGRPPVFCSTSCRRAAEFEIRRVERRLSKLEDMASDARIEVATAASDGVRELHARLLVAYTEETVRLETRLLSLVEDDR